MSKRIQMDKDSFIKELRGLLGIYCSPGNELYENVHELISYHRTLKNDDNDEIRVMICTYLVKEEPDKGQFHKKGYIKTLEDELLVYDGRLSDKYEKTFGCIFGKTKERNE